MSIKEIAGTRILGSFKEGCNKPLVSMATGSGKTVCFATLIKETGFKTLILCHLNELLTQAHDKIKMIDPSISVGIINGQSKEFNCDVVIASIQSARDNKKLSKSSFLAGLKW